MAELSIDFARLAIPASHYDYKSDNIQSCSLSATSAKSVRGISCLLVSYPNVQPVDSIQIH
jgi:hypothetical protein